MSEAALTLASQTDRYRHRYLQFLSTVGFCTGLLLTPLLLYWGLVGAAIACILYDLFCLCLILMLRKPYVQTEVLANFWIFATLLVTLAGSYFQKPDAVIDPWLLTCPVTSYALCNKKIAVRWTLFTLLCLFALREIQPYKTPIASTILLALAVIALSMVMYMFSSHIEENERRIIELSNTDALTGTLNRRSFLDVLQTEARRNFRQRSTMTVLMIDVDHFKKYNDHYGHVRGDEVLVCAAQILKQTTRRVGSFVFRYGGEEFCVLCSGLHEAQAVTVAEQLRANIELLNLRHEASPAGRITVSIGYRYADSLAALTPHTLVEEADKALYIAKANGRNRVERYV